jgi:hypothetical protein
MSAEVVIIIVGVLLLLIAIVDRVSSKEGSPGLMSTQLRIPLGIAGILLIIYGGYAYGMSTLPGQIEQAVVGNKLPIEGPVDKVRVLSPVAGDSVSCRVLAMGVYPEGNEKDIWVVLKPSDNKYYPQSDHTNTSYKRDGEWQVIARFGGDQGESYDLIVYETDPATSQFFSSTIQNWKDAAAYPGLEREELPAGAREVDRIAVSLRDNCRGVH